MQPPVISSVILVQHLDISLVFAKIGLELQCF